jgi:hypothetical protein
LLIALVFYYSKIFSTSLSGVQHRKRRSRVRAFLRGKAVIEDEATAKHTSAFCIVAAARARASAADSSNMISRSSLAHRPEHLGRVACGRTQTRPVRFRVAVGIEAFAA